MNESAKALTKAMYHLRTGKEYLEVFKIDCEKHAVGNCRNWINKLNFIENDVMSLLSEESREHFRQEIKRGDILFHSSISMKWLELTENQRGLMEELVDGMIKKNNEQNKAA